MQDECKETGGCLGVGAKLKIRLNIFNRKQFFFFLFSKNNYPRKMKKKKHSELQQRSARSGAYL